MSHSSEEADLPGKSTIDFTDGDEVADCELFGEYIKLTKMKHFQSFERIPYRMYFDEISLQFEDWALLMERVTGFFQTTHNITFKIANPTAQKMTGCFQKVQNVSFSYMALVYRGAYYFYGFVELRVDKPVTTLGIRPTVLLAQPIVRLAKYFRGDDEVDSFLTEYFENEFEKTNEAKISSIVDFIKRNTTD